MHSERFAGILEGVGRATQPAVAVSAFVMYPMAAQGFGGACPWEQVYRLAYQRAQAVVRPSILERMQANCHN